MCVLQMKKDYINMFELETLSIKLRKCDNKIDFFKLSLSSKNFCPEGGFRQLAHVSRISFKQLVNAFLIIDKNNNIGHVTVL